MGRRAWKAGGQSAHKETTSAVRHQSEIVRTFIHSADDVIGTNAADKGIDSGCIKRPCLWCRHRDLRELHARNRIRSAQP